VFVPVWTSQMNVADWQDTDESPLPARLTAKAAAPSSISKTTAATGWGRLWSSTRAGR